MEDWMPDESDLDILVNINHRMVEMERQSSAGPTTYPPPLAPPPATSSIDDPAWRSSIHERASMTSQLDDLLSDDDGSSDEEENLELELERELASNRQDPDVVKRLRHRLISRRSRQKKKRELDVLADKVFKLEHQYKTLQASALAQLPSALSSFDTISSRRRQYLLLLQRADQLRIENETLGRAVDKHAAFASSVQTSISTVDTWEKEHLHGMSICDFVVFRPLPHERFETLLETTMADAATFRPPDTPPQETSGWSDRRHVTRTRLELHSTKRVLVDMPRLLQTTWDLLTDVAQARAAWPFVRKLEVLQTRQDNSTWPRAAVVRRDFRFPSARIPRVHYATLLVVWRPTAGGGHVITSRTIDGPVTDDALGEHEAWVDECIEYDDHETDALSSHVCTFWT
ncbi:Aste57867_17370 [Aphanomyces stellatus]|uniref:Aste57867_17370 protein n=1 Tax=Aphanomyces stellatus TaxID=120398 RepID=A0A485LB70_9STRA|nr:hypothetical protein As57867_017310 [Aphanomyces stellatus]VFT94126.1 Aste57867_17370 [Aphanomyces stellatus]